jgi:hypothetical protein
MNEDDHIKQLLRFTSEDELIRLAEIGLAVEMHQAAQRFFRGGTDVPYTEETAAKHKAYLEPNPGRLMLAQGHGYPAAKRHLLVISKGTCSF